MQCLHRTGLKRDFIKFNVMSPVKQQTFICRVFDLFPTKTTPHALRNFVVAFHIKQNLYDYNWILWTCRKKTLFKKNRKKNQKYFHSRRSYRLVGLYFQLITQFSKLSRQCVPCVYRQKASMETIKNYLFSVAFKNCFLKQILGKKLSNLPTSKL